MLREHSGGCARARTCVCVCVGGVECGCVGVVKPGTPAPGS